MNKINDINNNESLENNNKVVSNDNEIVGNDIQFGNGYDLLGNNNEPLENDNDMEYDEEEDIEYNNELYKIIFNKIKKYDNFDDYLIDKKKNNHKIKSNIQSSKNNKLLLTNDTPISDKRHFNPRLPPYNKK